MSRTIVIGISGGIAAYKAASVCSHLTKRGYEVQVLMTENATRFIQPLTFQSLTRHPVIVDTFAEPNPAEIAHIAVADKADLFLVAPATANVIAKLAHGFADDMLTTTALATTAPMLIAPAMNVHMLEHQAVQINLHTLQSRGVVVIDPGVGPLACGYTGKGRLAEPEDIIEVVDAVLARTRQFCGKKILVTAGPTIEDIDPVRFLSNSSTGKMGYAIAEAARAQGAEVKLVSGPTSLRPASSVEQINVRSTEEMLLAVQKEITWADVFISAAAPADFRPTVRYDQKWKKDDGIPALELVRTPDIIRTVSAMRRTGQVFVGFAAETDEPVRHGREKLYSKQLELVVVNDVSEPGSGFAVDTNRVTLVGRDFEQSLPLLSKREVADLILQCVWDRFLGATPENNGSGADGQ